jgi:hypothetical protein
MTEQHRNKTAFLRVFGNVVLALLGVVLALGIMEIFLRVFPNSVPPKVRVNPPARRIKALIDETYDLRKSDGDLYNLMRAKIAPLAPNQDEVVAHVHMITDANGFRNAPPEKDVYDVVALGDSFTRASGVAYPWPQRLAEQAGIDVLNLADVGFGPQDELAVLQEYGLPKQPQWVILAYFEGNDLHDAGAYDQANPFIFLRLGSYVLAQSKEAWNEKRMDQASADPAQNYRYPLTLPINGRDLELTFFSYYISWLSADREAIESSQNYRLVTKTIVQMHELSEAAGGSFLLVYVPSKEHTYLPYLTDPDVLQSIFTDVPAIVLDPAGFLQFANKKSTPELTSERMDDQASLLADFAAENQIRFLDLTPIFQEEAGTGVELYYPYDTHWNQRGHDLAAQMIAEYIEDQRAVLKIKQPSE